jgi:hypothetical protein
LTLAGITIRRATPHTHYSSQSHRKSYLGSSHPGTCQGVSPSVQMKGGPIRRRISARSFPLPAFPVCRGLEPAVSQHPPGYRSRPEPPLVLHWLLLIARPLTTLGRGQVSAAPIVMVRPFCSVYAGRPSTSIGIAESIDSSAVYLIQRLVQ